MPKKPKQDPVLLKRIRETRDYYSREWMDIHKQGNIDVQFVAGDPWDSKDIAAREKDEQKRPHLVFDEASQYINGFIGKARQQKRSVKVEVGDNLAEADTASQLQGRIYHLWHKYKADSKTIGALLDASTRGYGFFGIGKRYSSPKSSNQEPSIRGFDNPDCVLMDPDCKEYDCSDATGCFVDDKMPRADFRRKYAKFKPREIDDSVEHIIVTEFWDLETKVTDRLLTIDDGSDNGMDVLESELPGGEYTGSDEDLLDERDVETKVVTKYLCQMVDFYDTEKHSDYGIEILEVEEWDDDSIPIIGVFGQRFFLSNGDGLAAKKVYLSLIRRARDPMGLMNLAASAAAERVAMMPKTRFMMAAGQEIGHEDEYKMIGQSPLGYLLYEPITDAAAGKAFPAPQPVQWEPQIAPALELITVCQNSIRSAVGQIASPELQKNDSGIAIKRLNDSGDNASFHLIDNFAQSIERAGIIMGRMVVKTHDTDRHVSVRSELGEEKVIRINAAHTDETGKTVHYDFTKGEYAYTISTGPSHDSQSDAIRDWATTLAQTDPKIGGQLLDKLTEMQNFGPLAQPLIDRLKKIIGPIAQDDNQQQDPAATAELQKAQQMIDLLSKALHEAREKIQTDQVKGDVQLQIARMDNETKLAVAKFQALAKVSGADIEAEADQIALHAKAQYDAMEQGADHAHDEIMQQRSADAAAQSQDAAQEHQTGMQDTQLTAAQQAAEAAQEQESPAS